jgi:Protein of unknown function (DUF551)
MEWISVEDRLPEAGEDDWSNDVYIKCNNRKCKGYYDHFLKSWFRIFKDSLDPAKVTHWQYIHPKQ